MHYSATNSGIRWGWADLGWPASLSGGDGQGVALVGAVGGG